MKLKKKKKNYCEPHISKVVLSIDVSSLRFKQNSPQPFLFKLSF